jgi:L-fucose isomerase-like protein
MEKILIPFFSPMSNQEKNKQLIKLFQRSGWDVVEQDDFKKTLKDHTQELKVWMLIGTGGTERLVVNFLEKIKNPVIPILISINLYNSLPAAMEIRKYLDDVGVEAKIVHNKIENITETLDKEIKRIEVVDKLKSFRLGLIGNVSEWLIASEIDELEVKKLWGIEIIKIPISELVESLSKGNKIKSLDTFTKFIKNAQEVLRTPKHLEEAKNVTLGLKTIISKHNLDAITIECFSLIQETNKTACYALSFFNDEGLTAGCEGDIPATFSMVLIKLLLNQPGFMANITSVNQKTDSVILAHCTVPTRMTTSYSIDSHFESGKGIAISGKFSEGQPVTIFKIAGTMLSEWYISTGRIVKNLDSSECCRTQVEVKLDGSTKYFLKTSLANHHIMILGDHKSILEEFLGDLISNNKFK